jgi:hypothetical protein
MVAGFKGAQKLFSVNITSDPVSRGAAWQESPSKNGYERKSSLEAQ